MFVRAVVDEKRPEEQPDEGRAAEHVEGPLPAEPVTENPGHGQRHHDAKLAADEREGVEPGPLSRRRPPVVMTTWPGWPS